MNTRPPRRRDREMPRDMLANWLALLTLLALGVVWPGDEAAGVAAQHAGTVRLEAPTAYALR
jgi:hypothetical protein